MASAASPIAPVASTSSLGSDGNQAGIRSRAGTMSSLGGSGGSDALAAFDLPSMPGPYEDFDFSLDLPDNILPSDLNLVTSPEFSQLFGPRSDSTPTNSMLPSSSLGNLLSPGATGLTPSAGFSWKTSAPPTPKTHDAQEDTVMASALTGSNETPNRQQGPSTSSFPMAMSSEPQPTSMPAGMSLGGAFAGQPPAAPFSPPPGGNLFGFDGMSHQGVRSMQGMPFGQTMPQQPQGLFNANESNFLQNFLSNFEGWDFNPSLPMQMPSFAEAEKNAFQFGIPTPPAQMPGFNERRGPRRSGSAASIAGRGKSSPRGMYGSPSYHPNANAAFGQPMEEFDGQDDDEDGDDTMSGAGPSSGKKFKTEHGFQGRPTQMRSQQPPMMMRGPSRPVNETIAAVPEAEKRQNHILSEQRRRGHIREAFKELVDMLEAGREFGARGLGLSSGAGTGIEDEGLDDRSDYESTLEDEGPNAAAKRRKAKAKRRAALEAARKAGAAGHAVSAALVNGGGGRGKGRGRGGSAGGGAGSKSAVLFQAVDLLNWLDGRNKKLAEQVDELEGSLVMQPAA